MLWLVVVYVVGVESDNGSGNGIIELIVVVEISEMFMLVWGGDFDSVGGGGDGYNGNI